MNDYSFLTGTALNRSWRMPRGSF